MSVKNLVNFVFALTAFSFVFLVSAKSQAQIGLQGTGYYGGQQACPYDVRMGNGAANIREQVSEEEKDKLRYIKELRANLASKEKDVTRLDKTLAADEKILQASFSSEILDFILKTHIEDKKSCNAYATHPEAIRRCPVEKSNGSGSTTAAKTGRADADSGADEKESNLNDRVGKRSEKRKISCTQYIHVPTALAEDWITNDEGGIGGYCVGDNDSNLGSVLETICDNPNLRSKNDSGNKYSRSSSSYSCKRALKDYQVTRLKKYAAADRVDFFTAEIDKQEANLSELTDKRVDRASVEANCEHCNGARGYVYEPPKRSGWETAAYAIGGLLAYKIGSRQEADELHRVQEIRAQMGTPPVQPVNQGTGMGMAYPFFQALVYGGVSGGTGQGAFGCASGVNGTGYPYGVNGNPYAVGNNPFGPYAGANGGAFGYPRDMYGNVLGGGAYNPGFNAYGGMNGPGNLNGSGGMMCFTWPCPQGNGGMGGIGGQLGIGNGAGYPYGPGGQIGANGQFGFPGGNGAGYPYGPGGQLGANGQFGFPGGNGMFGPGLGGPGQYGLGLQNPQYQLQMLQQQQQMFDAQSRQQAQLAQYYQAQAQAQQQAMIRQQQVQQQAAQVTQEIQSLQARLQMLYSGAYAGGNTGSLYGVPSLGGSPYPGAPFGGSIGIGFNVGINAGVGASPYQSAPYQTAPYGGPQYGTPPQLGVQPGVTRGR